MHIQILKNCGFVSIAYVRLVTEITFDSALAMKFFLLLVLLLVLLLAAASHEGRAQNELIAIAYNGRIEYYWVLYTSIDGRHTKITNYHSAISFFVDTKYLNSITLNRPAERRIRVVRTLR